MHRKRMEWDKPAPGGRQAYLELQSRRYDPADLALMDRMAQ